MVNIWPTFILCLFLILLTEAISWIETRYFLEIDPKFSPLRTRCVTYCGANLFDSGRAAYFFSNDAVFPNGNFNS